MEDIRTPSYYTVIPAPVRYDPELTFFEIVLFSELVAMSTAFGFAFVSNTYLARIYHKDDKMISKAISKLAVRKHIHVEIENGYQRKIFIITPPLVKNDNPPIVKNDNGSRAQVEKHLKEKNSFNKTSFNTQDITPAGVKFSKTKKQVKTVDVEVPWLDDYLASIE